MHSMLLRHARSYIIPLLILMVTLLADTVFSPDAGLLKGLVNDEVTIRIDGNNSSPKVDEEESDSIYTLPPESRSLLSPWVKALQKRDYHLALKRIDSLGFEVWKEAKYKGITRYYMKEYEAADSLLAVSVQEEPRDAESWYTRGRAAFRMGNYSKATHYCDKALALDSLLSGAYFYQGRVALKKGDKTRARNLVTEALRVGYSKDDCWYFKGLTYGEDEQDSAAFCFSEVIRYNPKTIKGRIKLAEVYSSRDELTKAIELYERVLSISPERYDARLELLHAYLSLRDYHQASIHLAKLKAQNPNDVEVLYEEAKLLGLQGRDKAALKIYNSIAKMDTKNPRVYYNMGVNLMDLGQRSKAVKAYKKALAINEYYWQAAYNLGVHYLKSDKLKSAQKYLERSHRVQPEHVGSLYNLGLIRFKRRDYSGANEWFHRVLSIKKNHYASRYNLAVSLIKMDEFAKADALLDSILTVKPKDSKALFQKGLIALKDEKYDRAESLFSAVVALDSSSDAALYNLMLVYERTEKYEKAKETVEGILDINPRNSKALLKKGEILLEMKAPKKEVKRVTEKLGTLKLSRHERAEYATLLERSGQFTSAVKIQRGIYKKKKSTRNRLNLARVLVKSGKSKEGLKHFRGLYDTGTLTDEQLLQYVDALKRAKKPIRATNILIELVEKNPKKSAYREALAELYMARSKYTQAAKSYRRLYRLTKEDRYRKGEALAYLKANNYAKAKALYAAILKKHPTDWDALYQSALVTVRSGAMEEAIVAWDRFITAFPTDSRGYYQKGKVYFSTEQYTLAKELFQKDEVSKKQPYAHFYLASIFTSEGDSLRASEHLNKYLRAFPTSKRGITLRKQLMKEEAL